MKILTVTLLVGSLGLVVPLVQQAQATSHDKTGSRGPGMMGQNMISPGLMMPSMDAVRGRALFASKGCVVCHSINGVGGEDAPPLDASTMPMPMNPFEFAAKMWRGAEAMVALQRAELGSPIELNGQELADIIAFVHDAGAQQRFSEANIPPRIRVLLEHEEDEEDDDHENDEPGH